MYTNNNHHGRPVYRRDRGSIYILVFGASLLVATIGIASLMVTRVQRKSIEATAGMAQARENARTAIDRGLWEIKTNAAGYRATFAAQTLTNVPFGDGSFTLKANDPGDNNLLDDPTEPFILIGIGMVGLTEYNLSVALNGDGTVQPGTWKRVVTQGPIASVTAGP